jgi:hypothetical protein
MLIVEQFVLIICRDKFVEQCGGKFKQFTRAFQFSGVKFEFTRPVFIQFCRAQQFE